ncbi:MAG: hypothetical protein QG654_378 [Patescibacteria group bacterium]|nr:hypothetical protein [Patescibacteria group bacterium]
MDTKPTLSLEGAVLVSTLFEEYRKPVFNYLAKNLKNRYLAEDIVSNVFAKVARSIAGGEYQDNQKSKSWVMAIAHNEMVNFFRQKKLADRASSHLRNLKSTSNLVNPEEQLVEFEMSEVVTSLINKLPKGQKELVMIRTYTAMSFKEIALMMGVHNTTLRVQYHKAILKLRDLVKEEGTSLDEY